MSLTTLRLLAICQQTALAVQLFRQTGNAEIENKIVYASFTSSVEKYLDELDAQVDTWAAKPLAKDRYYCVGDRDLVRTPAENFLAVDCGSDRSELACKMGYLFVEAVRRDPAWLVVTQSDMYINTSFYEGLLAQYDHTQPIAVGPSFGCGCGGFMSGCSENTERGGFCGGKVYAISGAAVRQMVAESEDVFIAKMKTFVTSNTPEDMANSCAMHQADVHMYRFLDEYSHLFVDASVTPMEDMKARVGEGIYSMHPVTPKILRWLQAIDDRNGAARDLFEKELFTNGDCEGCAKTVQHSLIEKWTTRVVNGSDPDGLETRICA